MGQNRYLLIKDGANLKNRLLFIFLLFVVNSCYQYVSILKDLHQLLEWLNETRNKNRNAVYQLL